MNQPDWQNVATRLREELAAYGGMLHLFATQQRALFARDAAAVLRCSTEIETLVPSLAEHRRRRTDAVRDLALAAGQPPGSTLRALLSCIEPAARPLLEALIGEVNRLLFQLRRLTRHNHTLLARSVEVRADILRQLQPGRFAPTYSADGRTHTAGYTSLQAAV